MCTHKGKPARGHVKEIPVSPPVATAHHHPPPPPRDSRHQIDHHERSAIIKASEAITKRYRLREERKGDNGEKLFGIPEKPVNATISSSRPGLPYLYHYAKYIFFPYGFPHHALVHHNARGSSTYSHDGATPDGEQTDRIPQRRSACRTSLAQL